MFKKILVACRGEIAMRVIRCCQEMGIETVQAYSEADRGSLPVQFATENVCIGPPAASGSYLNIPAVIAAAKAYHCQAIHPGYGFLSENADFAEACRENGIVMIGPSAEVIRRMGDKQSARMLMKKNDVPVVPGSDGILKNVQEAEQIAEKIGYPVLLKATAGGGGRGMRIAAEASELEKAYEEAQAEALAAFGNGDLYLEKLIVSPRHIEVQILGDSQGHLLTLGERDCSIQRRNQKLIEEAPAVILNKHQRAALCKAAFRAGKAVNYTSVGTVEFVLSPDGSFYFIEMNTRIQVEHTVTEMVTGIDLCREQIRVAAGLPVSFRQSDVVIRGHAIECRVNAENPAKNFQPSPGTVRFLHFPAGFGVRCESAMYNGCTISPYYDSLIAKIIVCAPTRLQAIRKMRMALEEMTVEGPDTNINFLYLIMFDQNYLLGNFDTLFLSRDTGKLLNWDSRSQRRKR